MITIPKSILIETCRKHTDEVKEIFYSKCQILKICIEYYDLKSKKHKGDFNSKINTLPINSNIKIQSINWFLKSSRKKDKNPKYKITKISNTENFFKDVNRRFNISNIQLRDELRNRIDYFSKNISNILSSKPKELYKFSLNFNNSILKHENNKKNIINELISFLFDYENFSKKDSIYTSNWGAYKLTEKLQANTCLYCNRAYTITVIKNDNSVIRPELDHFLPKSIHPILALSFYNLIPSCHTCNSNLKGKINFSLDKYFHPYLSSFDIQKIRFKYHPIDADGLIGNPDKNEIELDLSFVSKNRHQIEENIKLFKLNEIYNEHKEILQSLQKLQYNSKRLEDIFSNILIDKENNPIFNSEQEIYELFIRNKYSELDFHKNIMAKFERDLAIDIGLITEK
jgi:hypothetical protein